MNDDFLRPYKKLQATEDLQIQNGLLEYYNKLYRERYRTAFIPPTNSSMNIRIKEFQKQAGNDAYGLLETFFKMNDDWFIKQNHSLDVLINQINKVNAVYSQTAGKRNERGRVEYRLFCESCWKDLIVHTTTQNSSLNDKLYRCEQCEKENRPMKKPNEQKLVKARGAIIRDAH